MIYRFCNDERSGIKSSHPDYTVGDIAKELGRKWGEVDETTKSKYEAMAEKDKARYERVCHFTIFKDRSRLNLNKNAMNTMNII